ncbi:MAG: diacylglycerol kinase family protein [Gemmatimonadaceae bacterium]
MLPLLVVNPASGAGRTRERWAATASAFRTHFGPFECAFTEARGDATMIAERESIAGRRLLIACGGDGTVSEVANGILRSGHDTELAVLPSGTGGDFRRTLGIPARTAGAALALRNGISTRIDAARVSCADETGIMHERFFVNVASFGLSAAVVGRMAENSRVGMTAPSGLGRFVSGPLSYAVATLQAFPHFSAPTIQLRLDDEVPFRITASNLCVANARYFGGGMKIAPDAKLDDGWLDVIAIGDLGALTLLSKSYRLYLGTHISLPSVHHRLALRVNAEQLGDGRQDPVRVEADGELIGRLPASFEVLPSALRVRLPA